MRSFSVRSVRRSAPATRSTARRTVAIIAERFGLDSPKARASWACTSAAPVFGALWVSLLAGIIAQLGIFHPHSLAMGAGIGSASMTAASMSSIIAVSSGNRRKRCACGCRDPTSALGIYFSLFISLRRRSGLRVLHPLTRAAARQPRRPDPRGKITINRI
ncbi:MAG: DUF3100 domain-containing protein [Sutterella seckii]